MKRDAYKLNRKTYNTLAQQYADTFMDWDGYHSSYNQFLSQLSPQHIRLLEIGCGPGNVSNYLLNNRPDLKIHGIDIAPNMIELAKATNPQAAYEVIDCRDIHQIKEKFDAVFCGFCTPYISKEDTLELIKNVSNLLITDGLFYLSTMEGDYKNSGIKCSSNHELEVFIYYHEADYLKEALGECSFELISENRQEYRENDGTSTSDLFLIAKKN